MDDHFDPPPTRLETPTKLQIEALDQANLALQVLIELADRQMNRPLALELGSIKYQINQRFNREHT